MAMAEKSPPAAQVVKRVPSPSGQAPVSMKIGDPQAIRRAIEEFRRQQAQSIRESIGELEAARAEVERQARAAVEDLTAQIGEFTQLLQDLNESLGKAGPAAGNGAARPGNGEPATDERLKADARRVVQELRASGSWLSIAQLSQIIGGGDVEAALATFNPEDLERRGSGRAAEYRWVGL